MKKTFKLSKKSLIGITVIGLIGVLFIAVYIQNDTYLEKFRDVPARQVPNNLADGKINIQIGVIGDSWVAGGELDRAIGQTMKALGLKADIVSSGHPGAKSRQIYRNLFLEKDTEYSSNTLLMDENLDYLVVVAGVNDSAWHHGKTFYAHHVFLIIQTALARGIKPVIVEIPEYGIEDTHLYGPLKWVKRTIYIWLFDNGNVDIIREYRNALREKIQKSGIADKVMLVDFNSITDDYHTSKDLYADTSHLNPGGYLKLGQLIAHRIEEWHNKSMQTDGDSATLHPRP